MTEKKARSKKRGRKKHNRKDLFLLSKKEFEKGVVFINPKKFASRHPIIGVKMANGFYKNVE